MREDQLWVKQIICGKALGFKKLDIKGRSKMGIIRVPKCHIKIELEEKNIYDHYKMIVSGKAPPELGTLFKKMLYQSDEGYERVSKLSFMTTSKGRYYRRTQFKRFVQLLQKEYRRKGITMKKEKIERNLLEKQAHFYKFIT